MMIFRIPYSLSRQVNVLLRLLLRTHGSRTNARIERRLAIIFSHQISNTNARNYHQIVILFIKLTEPPSSVYYTVLLIKDNQTDHNPQKFLTILDWDQTSLLILPPNFISLSLVINLSLLEILYTAKLAFPHNIHLYQLPLQPYCIWGFPNGVHLHHPLLFSSMLLSFSGGMAC